MILSSIGYSAQAPGSGGAAATAMTGDSLTIENFLPGTKAKLLNCVGQTIDSGYQQITAPSFSDTTRGIRMVTASNSIKVISPMNIGQDLRETETLSVEIAGSSTGAEKEVGYANILYESLPGRTGYYLTPAQLRQQGVRAITIYGSSTATVAGNYSTSALITAGSNLMRTQRPYALVGGAFNFPVLGMGITAPDWSNSRIMIPGMITDNFLVNNWFDQLSVQSGYPLIPVFNSGNKASIKLDWANNATGTTFLWSLFLVELAGEPSDYNPQNMVLTV